MENKIIITEEYLRLYKKYHNHHPKIITLETLTIENIEIGDINSVSIRIQEKEVTGKEQLIHKKILELLSEFPIYSNRNSSCEFDEKCNYFNIKFESIETIFDNPIFSSELKSFLFPNKDGKITRQLPLSSELKEFYEIDRKEKALRRKKAQLNKEYIENQLDPKHHEHIYDAFCPKCKKYREADELVVDENSAPFFNRIICKKCKTQVRIN